MNFFKWLWSLLFGEKSEGTLHDNMRHFTGVDFGYGESQTTFAKRNKKHHWRQPHSFERNRKAKLRGRREYLEQQ